MENAAQDMNGVYCLCSTSSFFFIGEESRLSCTKGKEKEKVRVSSSFGNRLLPFTLVSSHSLFSEYPIRTVK